MSFRLDIAEQAAAHTADRSVCQQDVPDKWKTGPHNSSSSHRKFQLRRSPILKSNTGVTCSGSFIATSHTDHGFPAAAHLIHIGFQQRRSPVGTVGISKTDINCHGHT